MKLCRFVIKRMDNIKNISLQLVVSLKKFTVTMLNINKRALTMQRFLCQTNVFSLRHFKYMSTCSLNWRDILLLFCLFAYVFFKKLLSQFYCSLGGIRYFKLISSGLRFNLHIFNTFNSQYVWVPCKWNSIISVFAT